LRRPLLGLLVAAGLLGATEAVLRVAVHEAGQASIPDATVAAHVARGAMKFDPDLGWTWSRTPEPSLGIDTDSFRYRELPKEKPPGVLRAFTFGDSQTFGAGLDPDKSYTAVAERLLRDDGWSLELVDAAIAGYGSLQALRLIEGKVMAWDPDVLIVDCRTFDAARETREPHHRGALDPLRHLLFDSRIYYVLRLGLRELGTEEGRRMSPSADRASEDRPGAGNHDLIVEYARKEGLQVVFVDYPMWFKGAVVARAPAAELPEGVPIVPATAALLATGAAPDELFFDNNHLNVRGAEIVGETLAATLRDVLPVAAAAAGIAVPVVATGAGTAVPAGP
jgi:hypothetical protein